MNPNITQEAQQSYQQGQQLQNQYNQQAGQLSGQYQSDQGQANQAQGNLTNYTNQIAGLNYGNIYGQDLGNAYTQAGVTPGQMLNANMALNATNQTLAGLPQAINQMGNGYGTTAGAEANNYNNMSQQLGNTAAGQAGMVSAYNTLIGQAQNQANQQATLQLGGQNSALQGYTSAASNAATIMQQAQTAMNNIETLQQNQGYQTAEQQNQYAAAQNAYAQAQASLAQAAMTQQQIKMAQASTTAGPQMAANGNGGFNYTLNGQPITVQEYNSITGAKINPMLGQVAPSAPAFVNNTGSGMTTDYIQPKTYGAPVGVLSGLSGLNAL